MATHYTLSSNAPYVPGGKCSTVNIVIYSDNYSGNPLEPHITNSCHIMFDARDEATFDRLWLLQEDIRTALEGAKPGTFYPLPTEETSGV